MELSLRTLLLVSLLATACGSAESKSSPPPPLERQPREVTVVSPDLAAVVDGNTRFGWTLEERLASTPGNFFFSPFSISAALAMTYAGARGQTATELHDVLDVELDDASFHAAFGDLVRDLSGQKSRGYTLNVADGLFVQRGGALDGDTVDLLQQDYAVELTPEDFAEDPEGARESINTWAGNATKHKLADLFPPGSIDDSVSFVIANAIYFQAGWAQAFDPKDTKDAEFRRADGTSVMVPMMSRLGTYSAGWLDIATVVELPYQDDELSMVLVIPNLQHDVADVESALASGWLETALPKLRPPDAVVVVIPRFRIDWSAPSLDSTLASLGVPTMLGDQADFSGFADEKLLVRSLRHVAFVDVKEQGTEAAAATGLDFTFVSGYVPIVADHPFVFVIRDRLTNSVLFIGRVDDPTAG